MAGVSPLIPHEDPSTENHTRCPHPHSRETTIANLAPWLQGYLTESELPSGSSSLCERLVVIDLWVFNAGMTEDADRISAREEELTANRLIQRGTDGWR